MGVEYTNLSLGYPIFDVVSAVPRNVMVQASNVEDPTPTPASTSGEEQKEDAASFKPLPLNAFVVVGGGGSSRSGIKNSICILSLEENDQGLVQAKVLLNHFTELDCCTSVDLSRSGKLLATSVGAGCKVLKLGYGVMDEGKKEEKKEDDKSKEEEEEEEEEGKDAETSQDQDRVEQVDSYTLEEVAAFVTDKPKDESCHPCQNVVKFCNLSEDMFATGGDDCCVYVWRIVEPSSSDSKAGEDKGKGKAKWKHELIHKLSGHMKEIKDIAFDPTDTLLASASLDQGCRLFEVETGKLVQLLPADTSASLSYRRCKFLSRTELMTLQTTIGGRGASFLVLWKQGTGKVWEVSIAKQVSKGMATSFCYTRNRKYMGVSEANGDVCLLDGSTLQQLKKISDVHNLPITGLSVSLLKPKQADTYQEFLITSSMDRIVSMIEVKYSPVVTLLKKVVFAMVLALIVFMIVLSQLPSSPVTEDPSKEL